MSLDLVAVTHALRTAAAQIRALPDDELVAMALRAQQASEAGRPPAVVRAGSRRAEAPKSPASIPPKEAGESAVALPQTERQRADARRASILQHLQGLGRPTTGREVSEATGYLHRDVSYSLNQLEKRREIHAKGAGPSKRYAAKREVLK